MRALLSALSSGMYTAGAAGSFDLVGMHAYLGSFAPETDPNTCSPMCFRDVERFRDVMLGNGDGNKQAMITEMGALAQTSVDLGPFAWMELAPDVRALQMASGNYPWIRGAMLFNFDYAMVPWNQRTSEKYWFSLLQPNGASTQRWTRSPRRAATDGSRSDGSHPPQAATEGSRSGVALTRRARRRSRSRCRRDRQDRTRRPA